MRMRKIAIITGTRAEYGILRPVMRAIAAHPKLKLSLIVTGMHLSEEFGLTLKEIEKNGFKPDAKIDELHLKDTGAAMAESIGKTAAAMARALARVRPDFLVVLGDRGEMLAGAVAASYMNVPIAHIHGGEISGSIDNSVRHAITKLAHIHFPATKKSAERIIRMGEEPWRVHVVGGPALDSILNEKLLSRAEVSRGYRLDLSKPVLLVLQHSVVPESDKAAEQIRETLEAIVKLRYRTILIYPNADAGGRRMIRVIEQYKYHPFISVHKTIPYIDFLSLMRMVSVMVGNSSSGMIEAPSFHLPVVNIGSRETGRERSTNVIDVGYNRKKIVKAIKKALHDKKFRARVKRCKNPYGDGKAGKRIADILSEVKITQRLLQKKPTY